MRISLRNDGELKTGDGTTYGSKIDFVVKKNKAGNSYGVGSFEIWGDRGICGEAGLLDVAIEKDIIKQSGAWFKYKDTVIGQGRLTTIQELSNNSELKGEVERGINAS
jgi:recombination protein RecA